MQANTHVYMEGLEESEDENSQPQTMWCAGLASLSMGEHPSWLLESGRQQARDISNV